MPEMQFQLGWPDGSESLCYSPSLVIEDHVAEGTSYPLPDFLARIDTALRIASDRVQKKYGMPCARAIGQLESINRHAGTFSNQEAAVVTVLKFLK